MDEDEKICFDCASYFPASLNEATEYGICLLDEAFDPVAPGSSVRRPGTGP